MNPIEQIKHIFSDYTAGLRMLIGVALTALAVVYGKKMWVINRTAPGRNHKDGRDLEASVFKRNMQWAQRWMIELSLVFGALGCLGAFKSDLVFPMSHIDGIIALMSVIGIIGALWALFARIDAEKAFYKAAETYEKSRETLEKAQETLDALGNSFNFSEIFYQNRLPSILDAMGEEHTTVSLFLGFPCVACFYYNRKKIPGGEGKIVEVFNDFIQKLRKIVRDMLDEHQRPYSFRLAIFSIEEMRATIDGASFSFYYSREDLIEKYKAVLRDIIEEKKKRQEWDMRIKIHIIDKLKEKFRFAVLNDSRNSSESKAIIWIVPDFPVEGNGFESACFQTKATNLVNMLEKVFDRATDDSEIILGQIKKDNSRELKSIK